MSPVCHAKVWVWPFPQSILIVVALVAVQLTFLVTGAVTLKGAGTVKFLQTGTRAVTAWQELLHPPVPHPDFDESAGSHVS